jgi:hypothetical protein
MVSTHGIIISLHLAPPARIRGECDAYARHAGRLRHSAHGCPGSSELSPDVWQGRPRTVRPKLDMSREINGVDPVVTISWHSTPNRSIRPLTAKQTWVYTELKAALATYRRLRRQGMAQIPSGPS